MPDEEKPKRRFDLLPKTINGAVAGVIGMTCVFPIDLCKVRLQSQTIGPGGEKLYSSLPNCLVKTVRAEGLRGLYTGVSITTAFIAPQKAVQLSANDLFRYLLTLPNGELPIGRQMIAGAMVAIVHLILTTPMELLKIQAQNAGRLAAEAAATGKKVEVPSTFALTARVLKQVGPFGLYKGISPTALRELCFCTLYFPTFAELNKLGPRKADGSGEAVFYWSLLAGICAGSIAAVSATPFDVVKTRLQSLNKSPNEPTYHGLLDCFAKTLANEGPLAFFKGGLCRVAVIAPLFGITQMVYFLGIAERLLGRNIEKKN